MGHEEKENTITELSENVKRKYLINIITSHLETAKNMLTYFKAVASTPEQKKVCNKSIRNTKKAIEHLNEIKHIEILEYLYSTFIGNNVIAYTVSGNVVNSKKINFYDKDENIDDFKAMVEDQRQEAIEREKKRQESAEILKKAKEQGKKVEVVWDDKSKSAKPMIVEEKSNC